MGAPGDQPNFFQRWGDSLSRSIHDPAAFRLAYGDYIQEVLVGALWSPKDLAGVRIHWRAAKSAYSHPNLRPVFLLSGVYMFGSAAGMPRYVGRTGGTFWKRLDRYVAIGNRGVESQCQLAARYEMELRERGIDGFPETVKTAYALSYSGTPRLVGAVDFARHGIEGIWFTLLPVPEAGLIVPVENSLIRAANEWNGAKGYPLMSNKRT